MNHSFNVKLACIVGVEAAIIYENIKFWCAKNKANEKHFHDGHYWTYNSVRAFGLLFPYIKERQISRILESLENIGLIKSGNYNQVAYDRTKWYCSISENEAALIDKSIYNNEQIHLHKMTNGFTQNGEPIPVINSNINTDINLKTSEAEKSASHDFEKVAIRDFRTAIQDEPMQQQTQKEKKVAPKKEKGEYSKFIDIWREVESEKGTHVYNFTATPGKDAANGTKIYKLIEKEVEGSVFPVEESLKHFLILAYDYFKTWKTPDFKFTPSMCLSQYNQIKTTRKPETSEKELRMRQMFNY